MASTSPASTPTVMPDLMATGGRGLYLMAQLMDDFELRSDGGIEVRMGRRGVTCRPAPPLDAALGEGRSAAGESRTRSMLEDVSEAFVAIDWEYRVRYANSAALRLAGRRRDELTGRGVLDAFPSLADSTLADACRQAMELGSPAIVEHQSARIGWLEARIYPTSSGISVYLREINDRKRRESEREEYLEELRERVRLGESLEAVNQLVHSTLGIDAIIRRALEAGSDALGAEAASVEMREAGRWLVRFQRGLSAEALGAELQDAEAPLANRAAAAREPVVIEDVAAESDLDVGIIGHYGIRSCIVVPLVARGEVEGCLLFHYMRPHQFSGAVVDYAGKFGSAVSLALENARLRGREAESARLRTSLDEGRLGRLIAQSRAHPVRVLLVAFLVEAAFLSVLGAAGDTRRVFGLPGSLMALTVVVAGALAGSLVGVLAAAFGGVVFYFAVADAGAKSTLATTLLSTAIWVAAAVIASLLASGFRSQAERRRAASVALARAEAEREAQMAERERVEALAKDLDAEREQLRTIIEQTDSSIVLLDREFNFVLVNSAYAATCGYAPEAMVGLNHFDLYPDAENEAIFRRVRDTGEGVEYAAKPFTFPDQPDRGVTYWDWHLTATRNEPGEVGGLVFSLVEVTERVRAQQLSEALNTINSVVNARLDPSRAMEEVLRLTGEALECEGGTLVVRADGGRARRDAGLEHARGPGRQRGSPQRVALRRACPRRDAARPFDRGDSTAREDMLPRLPAPPGPRPAGDPSRRGRREAGRAGLRLGAPSAGATARPRPTSPRRWARSSPRRWRTLASTRSSATSPGRCRSISSTRCPSSRASSSGASPGRRPRRPWSAATSATSSPSMSRASPSSSVTSRARASRPPG